MSSRRQIVTTHLETTSLHAIGKASSAPKKAERIFWGVVFLVSFGFMTFVVYGIVADFVAHPTMVTTTEKHRTTIPSPQALLCPRKIVSYKALDRLLAQNPSDPLGLAVKAAKDSSTMNQKEKFAAMKNAIVGPNNQPMKNVRENLLKLAHSCEDIFGNDPPTCSYYRQAFDSLSVCYLFQGPMLPSLPKASMVTDIQYAEITNSMPNLDKPFPGDAMMVTVAPKVNRMELFNEFAVMPKQVYKVLVSENQNVLLDSSLRKSCDSSKADYISGSACQSYLTAMKELYAYNCTTNLALFDIDHNDYGETGKLIDHMPGHLKDPKNLNVCGLKFDWKAPEHKTRMKEFEEKIMPLVGKNCYSSCITGDYSVTISSGPGDAGTTETFLEIRLAKFGLLQFKESLKVTVSSVIGNVGGVIGVFIGASLISIIEVIQLLLHCCWGPARMKSPAAINPYDIYGGSKEKVSK